MSLDNGCPHCGSDYSLSVLGDKDYGLKNKVGLILKADDRNTTFDVDFVAASRSE